MMKQIRLSPASLSRLNASVLLLSPFLSLSLSERILITESGPVVRCFRIGYFQSWGEGTEGRRAIGKETRRELLSTDKQPSQSR